MENFNLQNLVLFSFRRSLMILKYLIVLLFSVILLSGCPDSGGIFGPSVEVLAPNGSEEYTQGSECVIQWESSKVNGDVTITLLFSGTKLLDIAEVSADDGSYTWTVNGSAGPSSEYKIHIEAAESPEVSDESDAEFTIGPPAPWSLVYGLSGDEVSNDLAVLPDGDIILAGYVSDTANGAQDLYMLRLNPLGGVVWESRHNDTNSETTKAEAVIAASDGGFVTCGYTYDHDSSKSDIYLMKTDSSGVYLWDDYLGANEKYDGGQAVIEDSEGNYVFTGYTYLVTGSDYPFIWKKSPAGANVGDIHIITDGASRKRQYAMAQIGSSYYLAGWSAEDTGYANLVKVSTNTSLSSGAFFNWERTYNGPGYGDHAQSIAVTPDGGLLVAGITGGSSSSPDDIYLINTNAVGTALWTKVIDKGSNEGAMDLCSVSGGGYVIAGVTNSIGAGDYDFYLLKISAAGDILWERTFGTTAADHARAVAETFDGGFVLAGYTEVNGHKDIYVVRTDSEGNTVSE